MTNKIDVSLDCNAPIVVMFESVYFLTFSFVLTIYCDSDGWNDWSPCSKQCQPGYRYRYRLDNHQFIEFHSCIEQDSICIDHHHAKHNKQLLLIQESRREHLSHTLIQLIILLSVAIVVTLFVTLISSIYLFRTISIEN